MSIKVTASIGMSTIYFFYNMNNINYYAFHLFIFSIDTYDPNKDVFLQVSLFVELNFFLL